MKLVNDFLRYDVEVYLLRTIWDEQEGEKESSLASRRIHEHKEITILI